MKQNMYFLILLHLLVYSQINSQTLPLASDSSIKQAVVRDSSGNIEYRPIVTPTWTPVTAGIRIQSRNLIRLNTTDSILTLSLPDGGLLRIIGISSIYIDYISTTKNNSYQTKMLLLSGRWFYSSNPNNSSRMIVNTDIITSVVENGSGGGFNYNGTNEFVIRNGRGIISYRQKDAAALVLDERQIVNFNIYEGFNYPKLATEHDLKSYIIFQELENIKDLSNTVSYYQQKESLKKNNIIAKNTLITINYDRDLSNQIAELQKTSVALEDININQLKILEDLTYKKKDSALQVSMSSILTNEKAKKIPPPVIPPLPSSLLTPAGIDDIVILEKSMKKKTTGSKTENNTSKKTIPVRRPQAGIINESIPKRTTKPKPVIAIDPIAEEIDINNLLDNLANQAAKETPPPKVIKKTPTTVKPKTPKQQIKPKTPVPVKSEPPAPVKSEPPVAAVKPARKPKKASKPKPKPKVEPEPEQELEYQESSNYYSSQFENELDPELFQYKQFNLESSDDLLNSEFNKVLFGI